MPPKVTYWTGTWDPRKEAVSKEINALRVGDRAAAPVVSFSPGQGTRLDWRARALLLSGRAWPVLRAAAAVVESRGDITHVFGGLNSWHLLRALGRRPVIMTAVVSSAVPASLPNTHVSRVVVETESTVAEWTRAGIARDRIHVIRPGVDLEWYRPCPPPELSRFTLLFASTPSDTGEFEARGIPLLVELARSRNDIDILVPWRQWGDVQAARRALSALDPPGNFLVRFCDVEDMRVYYAGVHATIVCFAPGAGKSCPNFVLEGLGAARPCISTTDGGLAGALTRSGAGVAAAANVRALSRAIDDLQSTWPAPCDRARQLAEAHFGLEVFRKRYDDIYAEVLGEPIEGGGRR